ncbi:MAG: T9SS type A sorting domain-containing protein [Saprospiraceae bacterium]
MQKQPLTHLLPERRRGKTPSLSRYWALLLFLMITLLPKVEAGNENSAYTDCGWEACPPAVKVSCGDLIDPAYTGTPTPTGECEGAKIVHSDAIAGGLCSSTIEIIRTWTLTDKNGKESVCKQSIEIVDESKPSIVDVPDFAIDPCSDKWPSLKTTWTDNCADGGEITAVGGPVQKDPDNDCILYCIYTFTVEDACGNKATATTKVTSDHSSLKPDVKDIPDFTIECDEEWPNLKTSWWDDCAGEGYVYGVPGPVHTDGYNACEEYRYYIFKYVNDCGKYDEEKTKVTRLKGSAKPDVKDLPDFTINCGDEWPELKTNWWDDCAGEGKVAGVPGPVQTDGYNACKEYRTYTFKYVNACGKYDVETTKVTRLNGNSQPKVKDIPDFTIHCGDDWPELKTTWWDDCFGEGYVYGVPGPVKTDGYNYSVKYRIYTFKYVNPCGHYDIETTKVTLKDDDCKPDVKDLPDFTISCGDDWPDLKTEWWDDCGGQGYVHGVPGPIQTDGYNYYVKYRIYTFKYVNDCGKYDVETTKVTLKEGDCKPDVKDVPDFTIGCGETWPDLKAEWWDNCGGKGYVQGVPGPIQTDGYNYYIKYRIYTFKYVNDCGKYDVETTKVTLKEGDCKPDVKDTPDFTIGCGDAWPELKAEWWDNCGGKGYVQGVAGPVQTEGYDLCRQYRIYTFKYKNDCGKYDEETTKVTRVDNKAPYLPELGASNLECMDEVPSPNEVMWLVKEKVKDDCSAHPKVTMTHDSGEPNCSYGKFSRTYTFRLCDDCGNCKEVKITYSGSCGEGATYCTITQGGWGNAGAQYPWNNYNGSAGTEEIISKLIATYGKIVIGDPMPGNSLTISSAACVQALLPATGKPGRLPHGDLVTGAYGNCSPYGYSDMTPDGRLENSLAGQVIALQLNIWYGKKMYGSDLGKLKLGSGGLNISTKEDLPSIVKTVEQLLKYANRYLAGVDGQSLNQAIAYTETLSKVNQYFDGCRLTSISECGGGAPDVSCNDFCTLTIGGWGNAGGQYPWGGGYGKASTKQIIEALMHKYGPVFLGDTDGNSLSVQDPGCVLEMLPGGGQPGILPAGDAVASGYNCSPYGYGKLNNLAAQAVALQLNLRYNLHEKEANLGGLDLGKYCLPFKLGDHLSEYHLYVVQDLLDFANLYLSGQMGNSNALAGELTDAISKINERFGGCNSSYGNYLSAPVPDLPEQEEFRVFPNPATDRAELQYHAKEAGTVVIRIMDTSGQTVLIQKLDAVEGMNSLDLSTGELSGGMYYIATQKGDVLLQDRLIIMND